MHTSLCKKTPFSNTYMHVKHVLPTLGSCEIPVRILGSLNTHTHICTSDIKYNQHQYLHNWVNSDFVHILLCRLLHQVRGNKAEPSEKMMSIGTWRNAWGICRRKKKMASWQKKQKGVTWHHNRQSHPCQSIVDLINWQTQRNVIHLQIEALVCLLCSFPPWIWTMQGCFQYPLGYRDIFRRALGNSCLWQECTEREKAEGREARWETGDSGQGTLQGLAEVLQGVGQSYRLLYLSFAAQPGYRNY